MLTLSTNSCASSIIVRSAEKFVSNTRSKPISFKDFDIVLRMKEGNLPPSIENSLYLDPIMTPEEEKNNSGDEDILGFEPNITISGTTIEESGEASLDKMKHNLGAEAYMMSDSNTSIVYAMWNRMIDVIINYRKSASASIASNKMMEYYKSGVDVKFNESVDAIQRLSDRVYTGDMARKLTEPSGFFYTKLQATFRDISNSDTVILDEEKHSYENYVREEIENEILNRHMSYLKNIRGGIFTLVKSEVDKKDICLLELIAFVTIDSKKGGLENNIRDLEEEYLDKYKLVNETETNSIIQDEEDKDIDILENSEKLKYYNEYGGFSEDGKEYFGAYNHLSLADLCVYTTVAADIVFEPVYASVRRNIYLTLAVLFLSVIFVYFFSKTISVPVKKLTEASDEIEKGNYILHLESKTRDEIGLLTRRFVKMGKGLDEREKLKDTFGRFINKEIAEKAMKGELALGGETKNVTVFFSDIRSFTAISEKLEPYEVVEFLNDYMTRMVECVSNTHGVVDKFIGDAIMGVWGAPVSQGNVSLDALNCVRAALMMRHSLMEFNRGRGGDKKPIIKIGCGINTGPVVAGQIGSSSRMEYTVIGDAVNFASRTEALNKPLGTDILITENTYKLVKEHVIVEEMPSVTVKGKEKPVKIFAVVNMPRATDIPGAGPEGPKNMAEVRTLLGIPTPDFTKVNVNEDEKKFKIQGQ